MHRTVQLTSTLLLLASGALAQGADDCAMATAIAGEGIFDFDNTGATDSGTFAQCSGAAGALGSSIPDDVWFAWTAPADGDFVVSSCGLSPTVDTKIAVYDGDDCMTSAQLSCNDDGPGTSCPNFGSVTALTGATAGQVYLIQIGVWAGQALPYTQGAGQFEVSSIVPVLNPTNGHHYKFVPAAIPWNDAKVRAESDSLFGAQGHLATLTSAAEDDWVYFQLTGGALGNAFFGLFQDMGAQGFSEPLGGWTWVTGEPFAYASWTSGEPNNSGGNEHYGGYWPNNTWNDYMDSDLGARGYVVEYDTSGSNYCSTAVNSTGMPSVISASGSGSIAGNNLGLRAGPMEAGQPGIFYYGPDQIQVPFGDGFRCIGGAAGTIVRMFPFAVADGAGFMNYSVNNTLPVHVQFTPGATLHFQAWFRDPSAGMTGFNLSDGLELTLAP
jgi:hypothetical protein